MQGGKVSADDVEGKVSADGASLLANSFDSVFEPLLTESSDRVSRPLLMKSFDGVSRPAVAKII